MGTKNRSAQTKRGGAKERESWSTVTDNGTNAAVTAEKGPRVDAAAAVDELGDDTEPQEHDEKAEECGDQDQTVVPEVGESLEPAPETEDLGFTGLAVDSEEKKTSAEVEPLRLGAPKMVVGTGEDVEVEVERKSLSGFEEWKRKRSSVGPVAEAEERKKSAEVPPLRLGKKKEEGEENKRLVMGLSGFEEWKRKRSSVGPLAEAEERKKSAEVPPLRLGKKKAEEVGEGGIAGLGRWEEEERDGESGLEDVGAAISGQKKEKRGKPKDILIPPKKLFESTDEGGLDGGLLSRSAGCPVAIKIVVDAAETYLHRVDKARKRKSETFPEALIVDNRASAKRFSRVMAHLDEARCNPASPSSPLDGDESDHTPALVDKIPEFLNAEFGECYAVCQQLVDDRMAGLDDVAPSDIRGLCAEVMSWYRKMAMADRDGEQDFSKADRKTRVRERQMRLLLDRMFAGFAQYHGTLRQSVLEEPPLAGYRRIREALLDSAERVRGLLPDIGGSSRLQKILATLVVALVFSAAANWVLSTWMPWVLSRVNGEVPKASEFPGYQSKNDIESWKRSLRAHEENVRATRQSYDAASTNASTVLSGLYKLTGNFTSEIRSLALQSLWSSLAAIIPFAQVFGMAPSTNTQEVIKTTACRYLDEIGLLTARIPPSRRTLQSALDSLDASVAALHNGGDERSGFLFDLAQTRLFRRWRSPVPESKNDCLTGSKAKMMGSVKDEIDKMRKRAEEGVLRVYGEVESWEGLVLRSVQEGIEGRKSWWRVLGTLERAGKMLERETKGGLGGFEEELL